MHVLPYRNVQGVAGLGCIHYMGLVVQTQRICLYIIETQVHIVGIVSKHLAQVAAQGTGNRYVRVKRKLRLQFRGHIGYQAQFVVYVEIRLAIRQVFVYEAAGRNHCSPEAQKA